MMFRDDPRDVMTRLLAMIGEPYEPPDGCVKLVIRGLWELGVKVEGDAFHDRRLFRKVDRGELGTVIIWHGLIPEFTQKFHVGLMLDRRWCLQSSTATFGVGRIEITRSPWVEHFRGFYRPRALP